MQPAAFDAYLEAEGVDVAVVLAEYSPKVTGTQAVEDMLPLVEHNPARVKFAANVNPHLHYPVDDELAPAARARRRRAEGAPGARRLPGERPGAVPGV